MEALRSIAGLNRSHATLTFALPGLGLLRISLDLTKIEVIGGDEGLFTPEKAAPNDWWNYHKYSSLP